MCIAGVAGQPQRLYYSTIANPESWPANNFIDIKSTDDERDGITALEVIGENLLVFKERSVWLVFDPVSFENRRIADIGCVGRGATARSLNEEIEKVYWVSPKGVYSTDGDDVRHESKMIQPRFTDSSLAWGQYLYGFKEYTRLCMLHDGKLYLYNWPGMGQQFDNIFFMDTKYKRQDGQHPWFRHINVMAKICAMAPLQGRFHNINNSEYHGQIAVFDVNGALGGPQDWADILVDNSVVDNPSPGVTVTGTYETGFLDLTEGLEKKERLRRINVHGSTGSVGISVDADEAGYAGSGFLSLSTPSRFVRYRPERRGRFFQLKLNLSGCFVDSVEMMYRGGTEH
jgi:hypothetical protein